jgi:hypothetical protein
MTETTTESAQTAPAADAPTVNVPKPETPIGPINTRFKLPAGAVTPIELRNYLVENGYAAQSLKPQQAYAWVKNPGKTNPFPVKFYEPDGTVHDTQPAGKLTRPGIPSMEVGVQWFVDRAKTPVTAAPPVAASDESDGSTEDAPAGVEPEGEFEEAE